jgi:hypothetical protein
MIMVLVKYVYSTVKCETRRKGFYYTGRMLGTSRLHGINKNGVCILLYRFTNYLAISSVKIGVFGSDVYSATVQNISFWRDYSMRLQDLTDFVRKYY